MMKQQLLSGCLENLRNLSYHTDAKLSNNPNIYIYLHTHNQIKIISDILNDRGATINNIDIAPLNIGVMAAKEELYLIDPEYAKAIGRLNDSLDRLAALNGN